MTTRPRSRAAGSCRRSTEALCLAAGLAAVLVATPATAQPPAVQAVPPVRSEAAEQSAALVYFNRPIVVLRARVLGRTPADRVEGAVGSLDDLVARRRIDPIELQPFQGGVLVTVASRAVMALTPPDVDELAGQTVEGVAAEAVPRLRQALNEALEARAPGVIVRGVLLALLAVIVGVAALWGIARVHRAANGRLIVAAERTVLRSRIADADLLRGSRLIELERRLVAAAVVALDLLVAYTVVTFVLRRFPFTRPWGESMRAFLLATFERFGLGIVNAIPGLFTAALVFVIVRFLARLVGLWFDAVEQGRIHARWIYPETAQPTRRLLSILIWVFGLVVAYPYLPGSQTDAFKGISVFLGLMITFGSSGIVNQIMSGFMVTFSRALRVGDFVRIGDVEGTVTQLGVLSTKVKTVRREEVTIPNAVVVAHTTTDYSRFAADGVYTSTAVTIGYDAPWRQVHALLLMAAERTPGLRREPKPAVIQASLQDFYVQYAVLVCLERQDAKMLTLNVLHANIQDLFNEYGVQIMSPNYEQDPDAPKVVPKKDWFAAPARRDAPSVLAEQPLDVSRAP